MFARMRKWPLSLIVLALLLSGCQSTKKEVVYHVGTWKTAQTIQPYAYEQYLQKVEVSPFTNPGDQKMALLQGSLDMTGTTMVTAIIAASKKEPVKVVALLSNRCSALVVGKDTGIEVTAQLKGKRIAYVPGTMHHLLLLHTLQQAGLSPEDVTLVNLDFFDMGTALRHKDIDAFLSGEPYPSEAVLQGYGKILAYPYDADMYGSINSGMLVSEDMITKDPEKLQQLVHAHVEATKQLLGDKESWLKLSASFGVDASVQTMAINNIELAWDIDDTIIAQTQRLADRMYALKLIDTPVDASSLFDLQFVQHEKAIQ